MMTRTDRRRFPVLLAVIAALAMAMLFSPVRAQEGSAPDKPRGLDATATHGQVVLTWDDPQDDSITGYVILRRVRVNDTGGDFDVLVADTETVAPTYTDDTVAAGTTYTYRIKAINEHGVSERSRWFHIDTPAAPVPDQPTGLDATASHDSVTLTWDDPGDDSITGYVVLRRVPAVDPEGQFSELVSNTGTDATTYTDDTVSAETRYTYRIKAINEHGTSERSRWSHINTPAAPEAAEGDDQDGEDDGGAPGQGAPGGPGKRDNVSEPDGEDLPADATTTGEVDVGGSVMGNIGSGSEFDWFKVVLEAGTRYQIDLEGTPTGRGTQQDPWLVSIYNADSTQISNTADDDSGVGKNARLIYTPTAAGAHYVSAGEAVTDGGTYTLSVIVLGANGASEADTDFPIAPQTTGRVEVGASATGTINSAGDFDWFKVVLEAGKTYQIDMKGVDGGGGTLADPYLHNIRDSESEEIDDTGNDDIGGEDDIRDSQITFTPTDAGAYYLVAAHAGSASGTYTLSVRDVTPSTDATLSALSLGTGVTLSPTFASDTYAYTASVANSVDEVTVTPTTTDSDATVEYLDSSDAALADADSTSEGHQVTLVVGNTVIKVKVTAEDGTTTQTYTVTVTLAEGSLVSNIGQGSTETHLTTTARSQRFRAGSNEAGYILTGVDVVSGGTHSFTAKVCGVASNNNPTSTCTNLTPPGSFAAGTMSFSALPNITLSKGTTYAVVLTPVGSFMNYGRTTSEREDKGKQPGSSIANEFEYLTSQTNIWTENPAFSVRIAIKGTVAGGDTPPACTLNEGDLWCGVVDVKAITNSGGTTVGHGFSGTTGDIDGNPDDKEFTVPSTNNSYTITSLLVGSGRLVISLDETLSEAAADNDRATLELGIDGVSDPFPLSNTFQSGTGYRWNETGLDWSMKSTVTVRLREEDRPTLSVADATGAEGDDKVVFTVTLSKPRSGESRATWTASIESGDTAVAADLGTTKTGTVAIAAGTTTATFEVPVVDDAADEEDETFTVTLSSPYPSADVKLATDATATGTIEDDDATVTLPTLSVADAEGDEDDGVEFTATLTTAVSAKVTATWTASIESGDTASAADLAATKTGEVEFDADATEAKFTVPLTDDTTDEPDQTFTVTLSGVSTNAQLATDPTAEGTIDDDDDAPTLTVADKRQDEDDIITNVTVSLSEVSEKRVRFRLRGLDRSGDTASLGVDWLQSPTSSFHSMSAGTMSVSRIALQVLNDTLDEDDETLTVEAYSLENAEGSSSDREATITIVDDDPTPTVTVAAASATEGAKVEFVVTLSAVSGRDVEVGYATSVATGQTATSDTDFTAATGTLTILASDSTDTGTVEVQTAEDDASESAETFTLTLSATKNVALGTPSTATGTINDAAATDDCPADTTTTCEVDVGGSATGNIENEDDEDWFKVVLEADKTYQIDLKGQDGDGGTQVDPSLNYIHDSDGNLISGTANDNAHASTQDSQIIFTPTAAGAYYLVPSGASSGGTYTLSVRELACTLNEGDIWCGVVTVGDVTNNDGDTTRHGFVGTTGGLSDETFSLMFETGTTNNYTITAIAVGATTDTSEQLFFVTSSGLTDTEEESLALHVDGESAPFVFSDTSQLIAGSYRWPARTDLDWSSETTVTLRLREFPRPTVTNVEVTSDPALETDTYGADETIEVSVTFSEEVDATSDTDFVLSVAGAKRAPLLRGSGTATLVFGYTVVSSDEDTNGIWIGNETRTLVGNRGGEPQSGTITSVATGAAANLDHDELGTDSDHKVDGSRTTDNVAPSFSSSATISVAENQTTVVTVLAADSDAGDKITGYALTGGADQGFFSIGGVLGLGTPSGDLTFDAAPNYEDAEDQGTDNTYVVEVTATSGTGTREKTATQTITVTVTDVDTEAPGKPGTPTVSAGSATSLRVNWSAPSNAGPPITGYDVRHRTSSPEGSWTEKNVPSIAAVIESLSENTSYDVQVRATNAEGTGAWSDSGSGSTDAAPSDDCPHVITTTCVVDVGGSATGTFETDIDRDWFRVVLEAGTRYQIDVEGKDTGRGTLANPGIGLFDASATNLSQNDAVSGVGKNARVTYTPTAAGAYYVQASNVNEQGTYTLSVIVLGANGNSEADTDFPDTTSTTGRVEVGASATGNIHTNGNRDAFRVDLEAGKVYQVDLEGAGTNKGSLDDPQLFAIADSTGSSISGGDNNDISSSNLNSRVTFTPTDAGSYYVLVRGNGTSTGTYTLSVRDVTPVSDDCPNDTTTTCAVDVGGSATGTIETEDDLDWFKVELEAGTRYQIDMEGLPTSRGTMSDPNLVVRSAAFAVLAARPRII